MQSVQVVHMTKTEKTYAKVFLRAVFRKQVEEHVPLYFRSNNIHHIAL